MISRQFSLRELFNLQKIRTLVCPTCENPSTTRTPELGINININNDSSLQKLLRSGAVFGSEVVEAVNCSSDTCNFKSDRDAHQSLGTAPQILAIHLGRYGYQLDMDEGRKNNATITFPRVLHLTEFSENSEKLEVRDDPF